MSRSDVVPWKWAGEPYVVRCNCQWGMCGNCQRGNHHRCRPVTVTRIQPATWMLSRGGRVTYPHVPVYEIGYNCRYVCPCLSAGHPGNESQGGLW